MPTKPPPGPRDWTFGITQMRRIKRALDPDNIMNPGKVLNL